MSEKKLIINNPQAGIAPSRYVGFEEVRNLNITSEPGVCYPNLALAKNSGTSVTGLIKYWRRVGGEFWAADSAGNIYDITESTSTYTSVDTTGFSTVYGLEIWKGYVFAMAATQLYTRTFASATWVTWATSADDDLSTSGEHPSLVSTRNGNLYIGDGNLMIMYEEVSTFDPTSAATYTRSIVLTLPDNYKITSIKELGDWIMVGTQKTDDITSTDIFVHDGVTDDIQDIIQAAEGGVNAMVVYNKRLYVQAGYNMEWFVSNGTTIEPFAKIPHGLSSQHNLMYEGAVMQQNGLIYFGNRSDSAYAKVGVWSLNPNTGAVNLENTISTGSVSTDNPLDIGALMPVGGAYNQFYASWKDNTTYGVDKLGSSTTYTGDTAYLVSTFHRTGTSIRKKTFGGFTLTLDRPMTTNDSVKVYYRKESNASWTLLSQKSYAVDGGLSCWDLPSIADCVNIQFKIVLNNSVRFLELLEN